jgi:dihydrolipoamide dehydrogenase
VARENEYTIEEIELAIHAHPTLSEAIAEAALDSMGRMIHPSRLPVRSRATQRHP